METATVEIQRGDRIIINNIPDDYQFKDLYIQKETGKNIGVIDSSIFEPGDKITLPNIPFYTLYIPYFNNGKFSCSGAGHSINKTKLKFIKKDFAPFFKFDDNVCGKAEYFEKQVNYFECEFSDLN